MAKLSLTILSKSDENGFSVLFTLEEMHLIPTLKVLSIGLLYICIYCSEIVPEGQKGMLIFI